MQKAKKLLCLNNSIKKIIIIYFAGEELPNVKVESIPCTVLTLEFFDRILDESNGIVRGNSGDIIHCLEEEYDHYFLIGDKLRTVNLFM